MNRSLTHLFGPEAVQALLTVLVFVFCSRHDPYSSHDVNRLERLLWLLPVIAVPPAYATIAVPGAKTWRWLGRVNGAQFVALRVSANRVKRGFVAPGAGPGAGGMGIFAGWFRDRRTVGSRLTALTAVVPIAGAMASGVRVLVGGLVSFTTLQT